MYFLKLTKYLRTRRNVWTKHSVIRFEGGFWSVGQHLGRVARISMSFRLEPVASSRVDDSEIVHNELLKFTELYIDNMSERLGAQHSNSNLSRSIPIIGVLMNKCRIPAHTNFNSNWKDVPCYAIILKSNTFEKNNKTNSGHSLLRWCWTAVDSSQSITATSISRLHCTVASDVIASSQLSNNIHCCY